MYSVLTVLVLTMYRCTMYIVLSLTVKCRISYSVPAWYLRVLFLTVETAFPPLAVRMGSFYTQSWVICAVMDILFLYLCVVGMVVLNHFPCTPSEIPCTPSEISLHSVHNSLHSVQNFPALRKKNRVLKILFKNFNCCFFVCAENFTVLKLYCYIYICVT